MPTKKEELDLRWANKSTEEKNLERKKIAEKVKRCRARKNIKKRSEMEADELSRIRSIDKNNKRKRRKEMSDEQREKVREKDRERKAKDKERKAKKKAENVVSKIKEKNVNLNELERKKMKHMLENCRRKERNDAVKSEEVKEEDQVEKSRSMREKRSQMTVTGKKLARIRAAEGMREHRKFGYLREYKQRKRRDHHNPELWEMEPDPISEYFRKLKESETYLERQEELKRMNRMRVERHRKKIKKKLLEPITLERYGEKGEYELLREKNIQEFERLKKESGLFD